MRKTISLFDLKSRDAIWTNYTTHGQCVLIQNKPGDAYEIFKLEDALKLYNTPQKRDYWVIDIGQGEKDKDEKETDKEEYDCTSSQLSKMSAVISIIIIYVVCITI